MSEWNDPAGLQERDYSSKEILIALACLGVVVVGISLMVIMIQSLLEPGNPIHQTAYGAQSEHTIYFGWFLIFAAWTAAFAYKTYDYLRLFHEAINEVLVN